MAAAVRTLKTVRPHIPLIKFPTRIAVPGYNPTASPPPATAPASATSAPAASKPIGTTLRGSGIESIDLPLKYQRKPIELDEMEFIERGGPA